MPELDELMGEIPDTLLGEDEGGANQIPGRSGAGAVDDDPDEELGAPAGTDLADPDGDEPAADDDEEEGDEPAADEDEPAAGDEDDPTDEEDDFIISADEEDEPTPPAADKPAAGTPAVTDENTFILQNLNKIAVRIMVPGEKPEDDPIVKTVEVYGYGDLPQNYLGFATPYEQGVFSQSVVAQETKASQLQQQFRNQKMQSDMNDYTRKENSAIAEDLTDLRKEGLFPKFKGTPGTKEFNNSDGAKEFDKVIAFMNDRNRQYQKAANEGKSFRHIGFREAYDMLNGPNPKAAEKREQAGRKAAAGKLRSGGGTRSTEKNISTQPVQNITDLEGEFASFIGSGGKS